MAGNTTERNATEEHTASGTHARVTPGAQARAIIARLRLEPHPEGGWYRRTWASPLATADDGYRYDGNGADAAGTGTRRPLASLIYFLLPAGDASDWHKVDADEIWLWHGPAPVTLELGGDGERPVAPGDDASCDSGRENGGYDQTVRDGTPHVARVTLGSPAADARAEGHAVVPAGVWQRTVPGDGDALVSCVVSPAFTFDGFELE